MSLEVSIQMILFSMLTCMIGSQGAPNKMAAANFLSHHFLNNRSSIQPFFRGAGSVEQNTEERDRALLFAHAPGIWIFFPHRNSPTTREGTQSRGKKTEPGDKDLLKSKPIQRKTQTRFELNINVFNITIMPSSTSNAIDNEYTFKILNNMYRFLSYQS